MHHILPVQGRNLLEEGDQRIHGTTSDSDSVELDPSGVHYEKEGTKHIKMTIMSSRDEEAHVINQVFDGGGIKGEGPGSLELVVHSSLPLPLLIGKVGIFTNLLRCSGSYSWQQDLSEPDNLHWRWNKGSGMTGLGILVHHVQKCYMEVVASRTVSCLGEMDVGDTTKRNQFCKPLRASAALLILAVARGSPHCNACFWK